MFTVSKKFTTGLLAGLVVTETSNVSFQVGTEVAESAISPSAYVVVACAKVGA